MPTVHPTAIVETGATLADTAIVGPYAFVSKEAQLDADVEVMQGAQICGKTTLKAGVKVHQYAIIGTPPQDLGYQPEDDVSVVIGEETIVREFVTINAGTKKGGGVTRVGKRCFIMIYCHIGHDCQVSDGVIMANNATLAGHVEIGTRTIIGGLTPIHQFVRIGEGCMIGGASAVSQDIPPFCLAEGNRAIVKGLNAVGLRRHCDKESIIALKKAYRTLFRSDSPLKESATTLLKTEKNPYVHTMCQFIIQTKRGIPYERVGNDEL
jgi:UDP-N-acetylglucosamine acyltransferase